MTESKRSSAFNINGLWYYYFVRYFEVGLLDDRSFCCATQFIQDLCKDLRGIES